MTISTLLRVAPAVVALLGADFARAQDNSIVTLQVSSSDVSITAFSFKALGLAGSTTPAPS